MEQGPPIRGARMASAEWKAACERALTDARRVSVNSNYFIVYGALRLDQVTVAQRSLLERNGRDVRTLSTQRLRDPAELESSLQQ